MIAQNIAARCKVVALAGLAIAGIAGPARATVLDDFLAGGYVVLAQTSLPGAFRGCQARLSLIFADGSRFSCGQVAAQATVDARVYLLSLPGAPVSVVLIGARSYTGSLTQIGARVMPRPMQVSAVDPPARVLPSADPNSRVAEVATVHSINDLQAEAGKRLNDAQNDLLPTHLPPNPQIRPNPTSANGR